MKGGPHRTRRLLKAWALALGLVALIHILLMVAYVLLQYLRLTSFTPMAMLAGVFVAAVVVTMVACYRIIGHADLPLEDREALAAGRPATAQVVRVERTRWHLGQTRRARREGRPRRWEHRIFVAVALPGEPEYEAEIAEFLKPDDVPQAGDVLNVKVHPRLLDVVVWVRRL